MLGIFYLFGVGIAAAVSGIKGDYENAHARDLSRANGRAEKCGNTYIDRRGATRDLTTNELRNVSRDLKSGDRLLTDIYGRVLRNLSEEERIQKAAQEAAKAPKGTIAVKYTEWRFNTTPISNESCLDSVYGEVYKDIVTGELYFKRYLKWEKDLHRSVKRNPTYRGSFYIRVRDASIAYPTEAYLKNIMRDRKDPNKKNVITPKELSDFINYVNKKQRDGGWFREMESKDSYFRKNCPIQTLYFGARTEWESLDLEG